MECLYYQSGYVVVDRKNQFELQNGTPTKHYITDGMEPELLTVFEKLIRV